MHFFFFLTDFSSAWVVKSWDLDFGLDHGLAVHGFKPCIELLHSEEQSLFDILSSSPSDLCLLSFSK